ncbi:uncharacterized protein FTOL_02581 [Fusarium torulosum]|uniref:Uncharacterized protein n=1 Tax=Fusarium torulosum TaxID=33205 RepID=A0AAE8M2H6_9HYPO|nr:uncharacterized protein FTOL_02581 [Fusarium torulosum]
MGSHDHQFSPELRAAIRRCALLAKREIDVRERHSSQDRQIRQVLDFGITLMHRVNHLAYCLSPTTRWSKELKFTLTSLNDIYTTSIQEIKGYNVQILAYLLCYTGDYKAAAETLLTVSEKYYALHQEWKQRLEGLYEQLDSYRTVVVDISYLQDALGQMGVF